MAIVLDTDGRAWTVKGKDPAKLLSHYLSFPREYELPSFLFTKVFGVRAFFDRNASVARSKRNAWYTCGIIGKIVLLGFDEAGETIVLSAEKIAEITERITFAQRALIFQ